WRSKIGVIFQDYIHYYLPACTNIGVGNVNDVDNMAAIEEAATRGGATTGIEKLPEGYDTYLGTLFDRKHENGPELSGGEWKKIALSRAFMRSLGGAVPISGSEAQLLILDEPTSSLDARAEYEVYNRFRELTAGKSTILISHRFSTVRMADTILVMQ